MIATAKPWRDARRTIFVTGEVIPVNVPAKNLLDLALQ
jgi:hypothetical protein